MEGDLQLRVGRMSEPDDEMPDAEIAFLREHLLGQPGDAAAVIDLALRLMQRSARRGAAADAEGARRDLDEAVERVRTALAAAADLDEDLEFRELLGLALEQRFEMAESELDEGDADRVAAARADRDEAAALFDGLLDVLPPGSRGWAGLAESAGWLRYGRYLDAWPGAAAPDLADLDAACDLLQGAVDQVSAEAEQPEAEQPEAEQPEAERPEAERPEEEARLRHRLAWIRLCRAESGAGQRTADLDAAITQLEALLVLIPDGDPDRVEPLVMLTHACWDRLNGDASDYGQVDRMVAYGRQAWRELGPEDEVRPLIGLFLTIGLFEQSLRPLAPYNAGSVDLMISVLAEVEPQLDGEPDLRAMARAALGCALVARGQQSGDVADLTAAQPYLLSAANAMPAGDPRWSEVTQTLATSMFILFNLGVMTDHSDLGVDLLRAAVQYPVADLERAAMARAALGAALYIRAFGQGRSRDARDGIVHLTAAHDLAPPGSVVRIMIAWNLGSSLLGTFLQTGNREDLQAACFYLDLVESQMSAGAAAELDQLVANRDVNIAAVRGLVGIARGLDGDAAALDDGVRSLRTAVALLPPGHPSAVRLRGDLGLALTMQASRGTARPAQLQEALRELHAAAAATPTGHFMHVWMRLRAGAALAIAGLSARDPGMVREAIDTLVRLRGEQDPGFGEMPRITGLLAHINLELYPMTGETAVLDAAVSWFSVACAEFERQPGHPQHANTLIALARLQRARGDRRLAVEAGLAALRVRVGDVMLQVGAAHGLASARLASADAIEVAGWCLDDQEPALAAEAIELGRGLVLHASTAVTSLPDLLAAAGHEDLAREWRDELSGQDAAGPWGANADGADADGADADGADADGADADGADADGADFLGSLLAGAELVAPSDLRGRTLAALAGSSADRLLAAPGIAQIADALARTSADALVYLLPPRGDGSGRALLVPADGERSAREVPLPMTANDILDDYAAAHAELVTTSDDAHFASVKRWKQALDSLCEWAWPAVVGPLLASLPGREPRIVLVPMGPLSLVPWHAARVRDGESGGWHYACAEAVFSYAASGRQLIEVSQRPSLSRQADPVIVAGLDSDLGWAAREAQAIRDCFYPGARYLGFTDRDGVADGRGEPAEVLAALPSGTEAGASVLHLGCHANVVSGTPGRSHLQLADQEQLTVETILRRASGRPDGSVGGLVGLVACRSDLVETDYDEALSLATAFLAAGAVTVVGARWEIRDAASSVLMFMFHYFLIRQGDQPRDALRRAQLWMLDPRRAVPDEMPEPLAAKAKAQRRSLADVTAWAGVAHQGQ
jgi:tetratricopeptide (TPR) repeat protein